MIDLERHADILPSLAGARVVVTGAAGFIGRHLVRTLATSAVREIVALDIREIPPINGAPAGPRLLRLGGHALEGPLDEVVAGADVVFHAAAQVSVPNSVADPRPDAQANILGTLGLLEACRRAAVPRFVYSSSAAVYGTPETLPLDESHPTRPRSPYGLSKLTGERYALLYGDLYELSVIALRYFNVYGPDQPTSGGYASVVPLFRERARRGLPLQIEGDGTNTRDFVHVFDVVRANLLAAAASFTGVINVGSGVGTSVNDLARLIAGDDYPIDYQPARVGDIAHSIAATDTARWAIGFQAQIDLRTGLRDLR